MAVEPFLPGEYHKHNNNWGFVSYQDRNTPQAFSHFTSSPPLLSLLFLYPPLLPTLAVHTCRATSALPSGHGDHRYLHSGGQHLVIDIQGVGDKYTDPQVQPLLPLPGRS